MKKLIFVTLLILPVLTVYSQSKKELRQQKKQAEYEAAKWLVESMNFEFIAGRAMPQGGSAVDLTTTSNFLRVADSIADGDLPYFGRAYNVAYSGSGGIKFEGKAEDYSIRENKKKTALIVSFTVKGDADVFDCTLSLTSRSNVTLNVASQQRDRISYFGMIGELSKGK
ncbi:MAG: DUF4251 domain-containing protein [Bacteroidales bacterium]|jgi:hypothetical protein